MNPSTLTPRSAATPAAAIDRFRVNPFNPISVPLPSFPQNGTQPKWPTHPSPSQHAIRRAESK